MIAVIIIRPLIMRRLIRIPIMTTDRRMRGQPYALALAIMTRTARAITAAQHTATGSGFVTRFDGRIGAVRCWRCADALEACG